MRKLHAPAARAVPTNLFVVACAACVLFAWCATFSPPTFAQNTVTGAFEGTVSDSRTRSRIANALVEITNLASQITIQRRSDELGRFYQGLLPPGIYIIRVSSPPNYASFETEHLLSAMGPNQVIPIPIALDPIGLAVASPPPTPGTLRLSVPRRAAVPDSERNVIAEINRTDARRGGVFTATEITTLPLGSSTFTRSFDELALLLPGVAAPPQTRGSAAGPGVGAGVGTSGQFVVNGLRSRANNFTVDGSDNNDEDIGVRRQGFLALVPQPVESVQEYQVVTLLAPAQFGRNLGAQVNAVSRSGGNETHGTLFGLFNSSQLNARDFFDTESDGAAVPLRAGGEASQDQR